MRKNKLKIFVILFLGVLALTFFYPKASLARVGLDDGYSGGQTIMPASDIPIPLANTPVPEDGGPNDQGGGIRKTITNLWNGVKIMWWTFQLEHRDARAALALGTSGDAGAVKTLINVSRKEQAKLNKVVDDEVIAVRFVRFMSAIDAALTDPRAVGPLIELLQDTDPVVKVSAALFLGRIEGSRKDSRVVNALINALEGEENPSVRASIVYILGKLGVDPNSYNAAEPLNSTEPVIDIGYIKAIIADSPGIAAKIGEIDPNTLKEVSPSVDPGPRKKFTFSNTEGITYKISFLSGGNQYDILDVTNLEILAAEGRAVGRGRYSQ